MSGAHCHVCALNRVTTGQPLGALDDPLGGLDEPLGVCQVCHILACGHHAQRDPIRPAYICVQCDPKLLQASAAALAPATRAATPFIADLRAEAPRGESFTEADWFKSLEEFVLRRPRYGPWLLDQARSFRPPLGGLDTRLQDELRSLPPEAWQLLAAAAAITDRLRLPRRELSRPLDLILDLYGRWRYE